MTEPAPARSSTRQQALRFALVGCINVATSFVVFVSSYFALTGVMATVPVAPPAGMGAGPHESFAAALANVLGYLAGMVTSFTLNKRWTFQSSSRALPQFARFAILNVVGLLTTTGLVYVFVDRLGHPYLLVWAGATVLGIVINFVGNKFWTFAQRDQRPA